MRYAMKRLLAACTLALLAACQSQPMYHAEALPETASPDAVLDPSAYPAAATEYRHYSTWSWASDRDTSATTQANPDLAEAVQSALEQHGLRPARQNPADLQVSAKLAQVTQLQATSLYTGFNYGYYDGYYGGYPGYYRGGHHPGYSVGASVPITDAYYPVERSTLELDIKDATGRRLWTGSTALSNTAPGSARRQELFKAARQALKNYPQN